MKIDLTPDEKGFWKGKPNLTTMDVNESYYGPCTRGIKFDEEFEIITDRMEIIRYYNLVDGELAKFIADSLQFRETFKKLQEQFFNKFNKKERESKKE
jgi:hypothetical protein